MPRFPRLTVLPDLQDPNAQAQNLPNQTFGPVPVRPVYPGSGGFPQAPPLASQQPAMLPQSAPAQPVAGGLASEPQGGLARFVQNVNKGIELVTSNPIYQRLWAGAVSGQANNAMAGPTALRQLNPAPTLEDQLTQLRIKQMQQTDADSRIARERGDALARAVASGDYASAGRIYAQMNPEKGFERATAPAPSPNLKAIIDPVTGKPMIVRAEDAIGKQPYSSPPVQVNTGNQGLNPYQTSQTEGQIVDDYNKESTPYFQGLGRLQELDQILAQLGNGEPTPSQSEAAATAFAKGLKPTEAVMRDDIQRILGQGFENIVKGFLNLPQKANRDQIRQMRDALQQIVAVAATRQRLIEEKYNERGRRWGAQLPSYLTPGQFIGLGVQNEGVQGGTNGFPEIER